MNKNDSSKDMLDSLDCKMIGLLQQDGRMSNTAMAQALGTSEYTVRTRLKRILESGIIKIVAVANPIDLGFEISGNLKIHIDLKKNCPGYRQATENRRTDLGSTHHGRY